jgi:hypothetical protein
MRVLTASAALISAAALAACDAPARTGAPNAEARRGATVERYVARRADYSFSRYVGCTGAGETIDFTATIFYVTVQVENSTFPYSRFVDFTKFVASGVGETSRRRYQLTWLNWIVENQTVDAAINATYHETFRVTSQGSAANYLLYVTVHFTRDANGDLVVIVDDTGVSCQ